MTDTQTDPQARDLPCDLPTNTYPKACLACGEALALGDLAIWYADTGLRERVIDRIDTTDKQRWSGAKVWHKTCPTLPQGNRDALWSYRRQDGLIVLVATGNPPASGTWHKVLWDETL